MNQVFESGRVAVITGAASGIGRAAARRAAEAGMRVVLIDVTAEKLAKTRDELADKVGLPNLDCELADVADFKAMQAVARRVEREWGSPALLMNNAAAMAAADRGGILDPIENWRRQFDVNVLGVVNGVQAFLPGMLEAGNRARIVNTGSKQGLTNPPGDPAYNATKAAVISYTQNLARDLRERDGSTVSAHLLLPGWTTTGDAEHRSGAWRPEQVIAHLEQALGRDAFFVLCPDDETPNMLDRKRLVWNALDIVLDRPALSRWHPEYKDAFARFLGEDLPKGFGG